MSWTSAPPNTADHLDQRYWLERILTGRIEDRVTATISIGEELEANAQSLRWASTTSSFAVRHGQAKPLAGDDRTGTKLKTPKKGKKAVQENSRTYRPGVTF